MEKPATNICASSMRHLSKPLVGLPEIDEFALIFRANPESRSWARASNYQDSFGTQRFNIRGSAAVRC
jgi:hypothetical protein